MPARARSSAAGSLPGEHALGIGLIEQAVRAEVAEDAALNRTLEFEPVALVELGGLVEADDPVRDVREPVRKDAAAEVVRKSLSIQPGTP